VFGETLINVVVLFWHMNKKEERLKLQYDYKKNVFSISLVALLTTLFGRSEVSGVLVQYVLTILMWILMLAVVVFSIVWIISYKNLMTFYR